jgi:hypothetical protein
VVVCGVVACGLGCGATPTEVDGFDGCGEVCAVVLAAGFAGVTEGETTFAGAEGAGFSGVFTEAAGFSSALEAWGVFVAVCRQCPDRWCWSGS